MSKLVRNEQVKLFATFCNNFGIGIFVSTAIVPAVAAMQSQPRVWSSVAIWLSLGYVLFGVVTCLTMHIVGAAALKKLQE